MVIPVTPHNGTLDNSCIGVSRLYLSCTQQSIPKRRHH